MKRYGLLVCLLVFGLGTTMLTTGCKSKGGSTRVDVRDDTAGPRGSGPYAADAREVTDMIVRELERQQVLADFHAEYGEAPVVVLLRPRNQTRFPEITDFFQQDFKNELMGKYTRREIRFVERQEYVLSEIAEEEAAKEAGELTDRRGRRTRLGVDFFIRANFVALSRTDGRQDDDTILYTYEFIDAATSELVFSGGHHIRRVSEQSPVYR